MKGNFEKLKILHSQQIEEFSQKLQVKQVLGPLVK